MGIATDFGRRPLACVLAATMVFSTVPAVAAPDAVLGTITVTGTAFASTPTSDWVQITATRPLVSGDRLKTERGAGLVADFHERGIIGLYGDSEISVVETGGEITVQAQRGKVAFLLAPESRLKVVTSGSTITAGARQAEGYVEFNHHGMPELIVESADVTVASATGTTKVVVRGDRVVLDETLAKVPARVARADERKAGAVEHEESRKIGGISPLGWTAIAAAVVAVGIGAGVGLAGGGGGGGGDDSNGSE